MDRRGLTPLAGFVLLVGIVAIGAMSLFVAGMALADATQSAAERDHAERSMAQLSSSVDQMAAGELDTSEFAISGGKDASTYVDEDAGHIEMWVENSSGKEYLLRDDLGAYVYETDDGERVAMQGGGVWKRNAEGPSTVVEPPEFQYRNEDEPTLTYNHYRVTGQSRDNGVTSGEVSMVSHRELYPNGTYSNPVQEGSIKFKIRSEYCHGWEEYFNERTDKAVTESCDETATTRDDELIAELSVPFTIGNMENAVWANSENIHKNANVDSISTSGYDPQSADLLVESHEEECDKRGYSSLPGTIDDGGLYCTDEIDHDVNINGLSIDEDVEIYTRNGIEKGEGVPVSGSGFNVSIYAGDDVRAGGNSEIGNPSDPTQTRVYLHSDADFTQEGNGAIRALLYAPESEVDIQASGGYEFEGSIIADHVEGGSASVSIKEHSGFEDLKISEERGGEPFYYLHISETTVEIENT